MQSDLIYDVGMHNGDDTAYYLWRGFRVVSIDANPLLCEQAARRFATEIAAGRLTLLNVGVAPENGEMSFWVNETNSDWSSFDLSYATRQGTPVRAVKVRTSRFADLLSEHGVPFYLKTDIEGFDNHVIAGLSPDDLPAYFSVEAHTGDYLDQLSALGYRDFKAVNQQHHHLRSVNGWWFPYGSSGPFGEDTPGDWTDVESVRAAWLPNVRGRPEWSPLGTGWFDFHARKLRA